MGSILHAALIATLIGQGASSPPLKLKAGDILMITAPETYGGEYTVMTDGAIYGKGFGRVAVAGLSVEASERAVRSALKRFVKEQLVFTTLKSQRPEYVFVVGQSATQSPTQGANPWQPDLTLRQLLASAQMRPDLDALEVSVLRNGRQIHRSTVEETLNGNSDPRLEPNDIVSLLPIENVRVWISGAVKSPGSIRVRPDSDLSRAIASAGGMIFQIGDNPDDAVVLVRRGPKVHEYPARDVATLKAMRVEPGDDISIVMPLATRVTVAGEVLRPGEVVLKGDTGIQRAIAMSGGATPEGTLALVRVIRGGEMFTVDAARPANQFKLLANDLLIVEKNQAAIYVLGEVNRAGRILMQVNRTYRVTDALAEAGGLGPKGTFRRVYLARADATGKMVLRQFNLDEFLKDGKVASNPELQPGDCLLFGQPNGLSFSALSQVLSSTVLLHSLTRN